MFGIYTDLLLEPLTSEIREGILDPNISFAAEIIQNKFWRITTHIVSNNNNNYTCIMNYFFFYGKNKSLNFTIFILVSLNSLIFKFLFL